MSQKKNRQQRKPKSEVKLAEERLQNCIDKRNTFNEEARTIRDERNSLHDQRNKVMKEVLKYRKKMEYKDSFTLLLQVYMELKMRKRNQ